VAVVVISNPKGKYYAAVVAAPVFSKVMSVALRVLNVPPDAMMPVVHDKNNK
jgi:cell division protein FtsI (penicillin-binding protein 3)